MKRIILYFLLFVPFMANGQLYKSFRTNKVTYYEGKEQYTVRMDSFRKTGTLDTIFYPYRTTRIKNGLPINCSHTISSPAWIGPQMISKTSQLNRFINKNGDTITFRPNTPQGGSHTLFKFSNGDYMEATLSGIDWRPVVGKFENINVYTLQVKDMNGNPVNHPFNAKSFEVSEHFGFVKIFNLWEFPDDTTAITLVGFEDSTRSEINPDFKRIFDFQPGNEMHYISVHENCGFTGCFVDSTIEKYFTLSKNQSVTGDTITCQFKHIAVVYINDPVAGFDTIFISDTIIDTFFHKEWEFTDWINREYFEYKTNNYGYTRIYKTGSTGRRFRKETFLDFNLDLANQCLEPFAFSDPSPKYIFGDGLGIVYFYDDTLNFANITKRLVYYQKGVETWGTPIDFDTILGIETLKNNLIFSVYPNPVKDLLHIRLSDGNQENTIITVSDLSGRVQIRETYSRSGEISLKTGFLPKALYIVQIQRGEKFGSKLISVQ
jgi:Secretion system C-terminal sorting domain